jgi:hypothetical protein
LPPFNPPINGRSRIISVDICFSCFKDFVKTRPKTTKIGR